MRHFTVREWAQLEAMGVEGAAALMREHVAAERPEEERTWIDGAAIVAPVTACPPRPPVD